MNYKQQFVSLKENISTHFQIGSRWRHAGSHSHLLAKMQQVPSHKLGLEIDKVLINLRRIEGSNWAHRVQEIESQIQHIGEKNTTLPVYRNDFDTNHILDKLKNTVEIALNDNMNLKSTQQNISFSLPRNNSRSRSKPEKIFEERSLSKKKSGTFNLDDMNSIQQRSSKSNNTMEHPLPLSRNRSISKISPNINNSVT